MFTMVVNRLTERMVFEGAEQKRNKHRLLFLIDEFPSLNRMEIFADALSYMAGYGLKAYLITQDIRQIVDAYGHNESIVSNCHVRIAFAPNQFETAELLSKMTGHADRSEGELQLLRLALLAVMRSHERERGSHRAAVDDARRSDAARSRRKKEGEGTPERIVAPGQMLIFVSGHLPDSRDADALFPRSRTDAARGHRAAEDIRCAGGRARDSAAASRIEPATRSANPNFVPPIRRNQQLMPSAVSSRNCDSEKEPKHHADEQ